MMRQTVFILCLVFLAFTSGCKKTDKPDGLPQLYPTRITITMDGQPLEGANVNMISENDSRWLVSGQTDSKGVAEILTHGKFPGAPGGNYAVCVTKIHWEEGPTSKLPMPTNPLEQTAYRRKVENERKEYKVVENSFTTPKTTPLKMEVTTGKNTEEFEVKSSGKVPKS